MILTTALAATLVSAFLSYFASLSGNSGSGQLSFAINIFPISINLSQLLLLMTKNFA